MSSRTDGHPVGRALIGLCAVALALQGIAVLAVDLPGCIDAGEGPQPSHVHAADDHPEGPRGLLALPVLAGAISLFRMIPSGSPTPTSSPVFAFLQPPRFA
jgi:hypothetical protein